MHLKRGISLGVVIALSTLLQLHANESGILPNPSGPNLIDISGELKDPKLLQLFVSTRDIVAKKWPSVWPDHFPYGMDHLELTIVSTLPLRYGTSLITHIESASGEVQIKEQGAPGRFELSGKHFMMQDIDSLAGPFPPGKYTCIVNLNGNDIAQLSWNIDPEVLETALPEEGSNEATDFHPTEDSTPSQPSETVIPASDSSNIETPVSSQALSKVELQELYLSYLSQEGYSAEVDKDGDILIKYKDYHDYIFVDETDLQFFRLVRPNIYSINDEDERLKVAQSANSATRKSKVAKVYLTDDNVWLAIELFVAQPDDFKGILKRSYRALNNAHSNFRKAMKE